ncbi:cache domain-containing sensor histidine kinase [Salibacterium halotolerans]|uniref:Two-component system, sensor histidine kinase YesM n=1 Tax=Salibacterium halotolerans TaxID=1884432 RepID=A0A1I5PIK1_9BACI|nr:sensor histidine kinase [Salibacterium halotolerans]SFP33952.1 two-component system, sensor histidine kinase YesM [Salibacterium halotolerans]
MKRIINGFRNRFSFKQKLFIWVVICMLLPMVFSVINLNISSSQILRERLIQSEENASELTEANVSNMIDNVIQTMNDATFNNDIQPMISSLRNEPLGARQILEINNRLSSLSRNHNISLSIVSAEKDQVMSGSGWRPAFTEQQSVYEEFQSRMEELSSFQVRWLGPASQLGDNTFSGDYVNSPILLSRRLTDYNGETTAYLFARISRTELDRVLLTDEDVGRRNLLLDREGNVLYGNEDYVPGQEFPYGDNGRAGKETFVTTMEDGKNHVIVRQDLEQRDWSLVSYVPYQQAANSLDRAYQQNFFIQAGAFLLFTLIMLFVIHRFFRPIQRLVYTAEKVEQGHLDMRNDLQRHDEIGRLSTSFDHMLDRIQETIQQTKTEQAMKRKAEMEVLQSKIQPHFLFNILNTIRIQMFKDGNTENAKLITSLGTLLRAIYRGSEWVTLTEETKQLEEYVKLINPMRKYAVELEQEVDADAAAEKVPQFILQPVIENACYHGLPAAAGRIRVRAWTEDTMLCIEVSDNGKGLEPEKLAGIKRALFVNKEDIVRDYMKQKNSMFGIGLKNVYDRMKLTYGSALYMDLESTLHEGTTVFMRFPRTQRGLMGDESTAGGR